MFHRIKLAAFAAAALAAPSAALAQTSSSDIQLSSTVAGACALGAPSLTVLNLQDLTGSEGTLDSSKTGSAVLASTVIANAWCNAPHSVKLQATPMALQSTPAYAQPSYMARLVTYNARLIGWPVNLTRRPKTGDDEVSIEFGGAYAPPEPGLKLEVSDLETLTAGRVETPNLMLEVGNYKGTVTITLATVN
ncbi:MAG: hypothetical protein EOP58_07815 [Sphingomonadales bacterium]|nr:MAG: hypothetical protein EOP58_07815 [Sphingomonadales bacterium]